jgi:hypothetical protein
MGEGAYMTEKEVQRAEVFVRIAHKQITKTRAAEELNLSLRQVIRLYKDFKKFGREALRSKRRGRPGNNRISQEIRDQVSDLVARDLYAGFRPKFMSEKLYELHEIKLSRETVRQIMIQVDRWCPNNKKRPVAHQQRKRRARYGELVQIDGSPHDWFEGRGNRCNLLVYIDDATGRTFGKFTEVESTTSYMDITREYITRFGKPRSFYSDKHSIFRINHKNCLKDNLKSQFGRALKELNIELICANSPQAKGRVERANSVLQDRLVKELRLANISTIEEANKFLEETKYWDKHNSLFSVQATSKENAHRELQSSEVLEDILCSKSLRKVSKNFELQYENIIYQISPEDHSRGLRHAYVTVLEKADGTICLEYQGRKIRFKEYYKQDVVGEEVNSKEIERFLKEKKPRTVSKNHPWKRKKNYQCAA